MLTLWVRCREGEVRLQSGPSLTEYTLRQAQGIAYTGQYSYTGSFGLMYYREASQAASRRVDNARWYDPSLGRFAQADSIVPPGVQGLDRYAYVNNSPVNYTDPTGHTIACTGDRWDDGPQCFGGTREERLSRLNITIEGNMPEEYISAIIAAGIDDGGFWAESMGMSAEDSFSEKHGGISIAYNPNCFNCRSREAIQACGNQTSGTAQGINCTPGGAVTDNAHHITIASMSTYPEARVYNMIHEFGHTFNNLNEGAPESEIDTQHRSWVDDRALILRPNPGYQLYQQNTALTASETFGDLYVAQVYGVWNTNEINKNLVQDVQEWISKWMP